MRRVIAGICVSAAAIAAAARPAAAATEIVLYASDAANLHGNWALAADASTAGGQLLNSADNGWASADTPLAAPGHYFEFTFSAPANTPFHIWLRLRAAGQSKYNDSVFAQFSDAINAQGSAVYRIGTANALFVNLQSCNGCALSGWGWIDGAYWLSQQTTVSFAGAGTHTLRIQTREDGVQFDEVVLSPSTYLSSSPGQVMNDTSRILKSGGGGSTPFSGTPSAIPGTIQAENFDNGGEGVAYHDVSQRQLGRRAPLDRRRYRTRLERRLRRRLGVGRRMAELQRQRGRGRNVYRVLPRRVAGPGRDVPPHDERRRRHRPHQRTEHRRLAGLADRDSHGDAERRRSDCPSRHGLGRPEHGRRQLRLA